MNNNEIKRLLYCYIVLFSVVMFVIVLKNGPAKLWEWDDYSLPVVSILNGHLSIHNSDVIMYKELFSSWADSIDSYSLSSLYSSDGGELTWYFPLYSFICIPFVLLLHLFHFNTTYAFCLTNITVLAFSLLFVVRRLNIKIFNKLLLVLLLTINPVIFTVPWCSAETAIYSFIILGLTEWYNKEYNNAAFYISLASVLNPTVIALSIPIFVEAIISIKGEEKSTIFKQLNKHCIFYIPFAIMLVYNYYETGYLYLQLAVPNFISSTESTMDRFWSYFIDLNYGYLPYYPFLLSIFVLLIFVSIKVNYRRCILLSVAFLGNVLLYSVMTHINCGMSAIARYNVWGSVSLFFVIIIFIENVLKTSCEKKIIIKIVSLNILVLLCIISKYGIYNANKTSYVYFTPIATYILDNYPHLYNPLNSTFNSRVRHIDGGYQFNTPVIYTAKDGYVRKILASTNDKEYLNKKLLSMNVNTDISKEIDNLSNNSYLSFDKDKKIIIKANYSLDKIIDFSKIDSYKDYLLNGLSNTEEWGTWSIGKECNFRFYIQNNTDRERLCVIRGEVYKGPKPIYVYVDNELVYTNNLYVNEDIMFRFNTSHPIVSLKIVTPDSVSPSSFGSADKRVLGIGLKSMVIHN